MNDIMKSISGIIGNTPLLSAKRFSSHIQSLAHIYAKLEYFNPTGSIKDRAAFYMLEDAIKRGLLHKDSTVIEPTSGNTGIGLAALCSSVGIRCVLTIPDTMSAERIKLLHRYGAEVKLTPGKEGMQGAIQCAKELAAVTPRAYIPFQFENPANVNAHYMTTGPELWRQTDGKLDVLVAGVGSGGTITGTAKYLKEQNPAIEIIAVEPEESAVLSGKTPGSHGIQGIGAGFVPSLYNASIVSQVIAVPTNVAISSARLFISSEGALVGISSGAALAAAAKLALQEKYADKNIAVICPDSGDRYYSTALFDN